MSPKRTYTSYTTEFKQEAISLITEQDYSVAEAAKALGVSVNLLYKWKDKFESEATGEALSTDEREELKGLDQRISDSKQRKKS